MSNSTMPRKLGRVALVLEVEKSIAVPTEWVRLTCSIPGRPGAVSRVWTTPGGCMGDADWQDLVGAIETTLADLLSLLGGAQLQLPVTG